MANHGQEVDKPFSRPVGVWTGFQLQEQRGGCEETVEELRVPGGLQSAHSRGGGGRHRWLGVHQGALGGLNGEAGCAPRGGHGHVLLASSIFQCEMLN